MAKNVVNVVKLQIEAGKATPAPPVGPALGQAGINIAEFTKNFNAQTQDKMGSIIPVVITVYEDRSFDFVTKTPPASDMIKKATKVAKGSGEPNRVKVTNLTMAQVKEIAEAKMPDLNAATIEAAMNIVMGTARSMGVTVDGIDLTTNPIDARGDVSAQEADAPLAKDNPAPAPAPEAAQEATPAADEAPAEEAETTEGGEA